MRQYLCSTTYFETRGNKISSTVLQNMGFMELCHSQQHQFEGCSHIGGSEQTYGQVEQEKGYGNRMVTQQVSCTSIISDLGVSINRPVYLSRESSDSDFLLIDSTSRSFSTGCPVNFMGKMFGYAYPSICLIPKVLQHITPFKCQIIPIVPRWPRRNWYTQLLQLLLVPGSFIAVPTYCFNTKH